MVNYNIIVNWFVNEESYNIAIIVKYDKFNNNFIVTTKSLNGENFDFFADCYGTYETVNEVQAGISNYILCISPLYPESTIIKSWYSRSDEEYRIIENYEFFENLTEEEFNKLRKTKKIFYYRGGKDVIDNVRHEILIK